MSADTINQQITMVGISTFTLYANVAGTYSLRGNLSLPTANTESGDDSQCVVTVKKNGSTIYTGTAGATGFTVQPPFVCALGDAIQILFTSAAAVDQPVNAIKATISFFLGY